MLLKSGAERPPACISDLAFDQWEAGELARERSDELARHLAQCARCSGQRQSLRAQAQAFIDGPGRPERLPRLQARLVQQRTGRPRPRDVLRALPVAAGLVAAAAAAAVLLVLAPGDPEHATRRKGSAAVGFFVKRGERVQRGSDGERVQPGDQLRFTLRSDRPTHLSILSLDARGVVSVYYPRTAAARPLQPVGEELALDAGVELDDTLGPETIFAVRCPTPPAVDALRSTLQRARTLPAPPGCEIDVLRLFKEPKAR
jgi:hypothetical protein